MVSTASLRGARHLGKVVKNKPASSLVYVLGARNLTGHPHLHVGDRWPINFRNGNSQASADIPSKI